MERVVDPADASLLATSVQERVSRVTAFIHHHLLGFLLAMYAVAVVLPHPGLALRKVGIGTAFNAPQVMLGFLLFNAGLGIRSKELKNIKNKFKLLSWGLFANTAVPLTLLFIVAGLGRFWGNGSEMQTVLVGLAIISAMPIAGSSTAWTQNVGGNIVISLGLVVLSTLCSPALSPLGFKLASFITKGEYSGDLVHLQGGGTIFFLISSVVIPSFLGILFRSLMGERRIAQVSPTLKCLSLLNLLILNYSNAAVALPQAFRNPDWDFLVLIIVVTTLFSLAGFVAGAIISRMTNSDKSECAALMYGLGMNNNGTGLVLASSQVSHHPLIMLPIIFFNLEQQIIAGIVSRWLDSDRDSSIT